MPAWQDIDLTSTPLRRRRGDLAEVTLGDEAVLYVAEKCDTHHMNTAAASVWRCLDGDTSLGELAEDIAVVTGWDRVAIEADLLTVVRGFGRDGLLAGVVPVQDRGRPLEETVAESEASRLVRVPPGECAERSDLPWAATKAVRVGRYVIGVRSAPGVLDELVSTMLGRHVVPEVQAPPNCSVRLASTDGLRFHRLFRGCETSVRTRSLRRLLQALGGFLAAYAAEDDADAVHVDALVLVHRGEALLLPRELRPLLPAEEAMRRRGLRVLDAATAALEPGSGELMIPPPLFEIDSALATRVAALENEAPESALSAAPGRFPVRAWAYLTVGDGSPSGPASVVAAANRRVRNRSAVGAQTALSTLAELASTTSLVPVAPTEPTSVTLDRLVEPTSPSSAY